MVYAQNPSNGAYSAIPGPLNDAWAFLTDISNKLQEKLPKYELITSGPYMNDFLRSHSVSYTSVSDVVQRIVQWYNENVNLANAPGFIDGVAALAQKLFELIAQGIRWLVNYL